MIHYGINQIGEGSKLFEGITLGFPSRSRMGTAEFPGTVVGEEEIEAVAAVMRFGMLAQGDMVTEFEEEFASYYNTSHGIEVNFGIGRIAAG